MSNYSESYTFKFEGKMVEVLVLFSDTGSPMFVKVDAPLDRADKLSFDKVCITANGLLKSNIFDYKQYKQAINNLVGVELRIKNFFERNIFGLLKIE
jgi:hypothetical protein